jgi:hypothetical protein
MLTEGLTDRARLIGTFLQLLVVDAAEKCYVLSSNGIGYVCYSMHLWQVILIVNNYCTYWAIFLSSS